MRTKFFLSTLVAALCFAAVAGAADSPAEASKEPPWRYVLEWFREQRDRMSADLEKAHASLLARAEAEGATDLVERLTVEPPRPRPHGYQVLPEISAAAPVLPVELRERTYSLESLTVDHAPSLRDAALLARRVTADGNLPLEPWVSEFERLRKRMRNLEDHLDYHAKWQAAIVEFGPFFARRNRLVARVREMVELRDGGGSPDVAAELRSKILDELAPFRKTKGLEIERRKGGEQVLPVRVYTDIEDDAFLGHFGDAVREAYCDSEAARARRFAVELTWERLPVSRLYPEGPPGAGEEIDVEAHRVRFPDGALVLTTGAESTYATTGKAVLLGPSPLSSRHLAHEFGHLLGFDDAYLRGYDGHPDGPFGAVVIEWIGLKNDLMGNPKGGLVTAQMVDELIEAYSTD